MNFQLIYGGAGLSGHEIDPKDLSSALLGIDNLLGEANHILNGDRVKVKVKVKGSFETGSFKINFNVIQDLIEKTKNLFSDLSVSDAAAIVSLLVFGTTGFVSLMKFLKGLRPDKIYENEDGTFSVEKQGKLIKVEKQTIEFYKNYKLRKAFEQVVSPVKSEGISDCAFMRIENGKKEFVAVSKDEVQYFDTMEPSRKLLDDTVKFITNINIISLSFNANNKWYVNDGQSSYYVTVEDKEFLEKVDNNKPFSKGDVMKVKLRREQYYIGDEAKLKVDVFIESVLEHQTPKQFSQKNLV